MTETTASPSSGWNDEKLHEHLRWLMDHLHNVTVLADAKAGLVIAIHGALLAGICEAMQQVLEALERSNWAVETTMGLYTVAAALSIWGAFDAIRPRTAARRVAILQRRTPVAYYGDIAESASGKEYLEQLNRDEETDRNESFAQSAVHMSHIVGLKLARTRFAMHAMAFAIALWLVGMGAVLLTLFTPTPGEAAAAAADREAPAAVVAGEKAAATAGGEEAGKPGGD